VIIYLYDCDCGKCYDVVNPNLFALFYPRHVKSFGFAVNNQKTLNRLKMETQYQAGVIVVGETIKKNRYGYQETVEVFNNWRTHPDQPKINIKSINLLKANNELSLEQEAKD
jgi:hypothetical protein